MSFLLRFMLGFKQWCTLEQPFILRSYITVDSSLCHRLKFPKANVGNILSKLRSIGEEKRSEIRKFLALSDPSKTGFIPYESFRYSTAVFYIYTVYMWIDVEHQSLPSSTSSSNSTG